LPFPDFDILDYQFVSLRHPEEYGILSGEVFSSNGRQTSLADFEKDYIETHVRHSNALHSHTIEGGAYITGPLSRLNLNNEQLIPDARQIIEEIGLQFPIQNPYKALLARAIELVEVCSEAISLAKSYNPQGQSQVNVTPHAGEGHGASEAPRGLLYHHYVIDEQGKVLHARIIPPTAQNLARIEADLWKLAPTVVDLPQDQATLLCEHLVRSYDPCISCATHFLKLNVEEV
jgi:coenzyme F420-reducing hydrogenase alpha subunit